MTLSIQVWSELTPAERRRALTRPAREVAERVERDVAVIIRRVREEGDAAVRAITLELDGAALDAIEVEEAALEAAERIAGAEELRPPDPAHRCGGALRSGRQRPAAVHRAHAGGAGSAGRVPAQNPVHTAPR